MPLRLHKINLSQFRNYEALRLDAGVARAIVLTGDNGAGKTNILEAISLLVPGKGLRGAEATELKNRHADLSENWAISAELETAQGEKIRIGIGAAADGKRRAVRVGGKDAKNQRALSAYAAAVWLTPQMDRLFLEGPSARRKFIDRLAFSFTPDHVTQTGRYEKALRERLRILQNPRMNDPSWLATLEAQIAAGAVSIAATRGALINSLMRHGALLGAQAPLFPRPSLNMTGWVDAELENRPALDVEEELKEKLAKNRGLDRDSGRTHEGAHRSDLSAFYADENMPAAQCSTGEQKALLVSIILAHALMMKSEKGYVPLILLDEVAAHLDEARREQLFSVLSALEGQIWLTGTDARIFAPLRTNARFFHVEGGHAHESGTTARDIAS